ncbi:MAG: hypothetical protein RLZZ330_242 [Actinomycetota bacterium]
MRLSGYGRKKSCTDVASTFVRKLRLKADFETALSKHSGLRCKYTPRPGCFAFSSTRSCESTRTRRTRPFFAWRIRHPTQVRVGRFGSAGTNATPDSWQFEPTLSREGQHRSEYRSSSQSNEQLVGHSALPCQWLGIAENLVRTRERGGLLGR